MVWLQCVFTSYLTPENPHRKESYNTLLPENLQTLLCLETEVNQPQEPNKKKPQTSLVSILSALFISFMAVLEAGMAFQ